MENLELDIVQISKNLTFLRKRNNMTQLQLAERLHYSDKSISKWERGEALPDTSILYNLANLYTVKIDDIICGDEKSLAHILDTATENNIKKLKIKRSIITLLTFCAVWFVAVAVFVLGSILNPSENYIWLVFIYAIPLSSVVSIIFCALWFGKLLTTISVSVLVWSLCLSIYLTFEMSGLWLIFFVGLSMQVIIILWHKLYGIISTKYNNNLTE